MKTFQMALVGLTMLSSAAHGKGDHHDTMNSASSTDREQYSADSSSAPRATGRLVKSGNDCAPDTASPVWGPGDTLAGYACVNLAN